MTVKINIRRLVKEDHVSWKELFQGYLEFYEAKIPEQVQEKSFQALCDPDQIDRYGLIAETQGEVLGIANIIIHAHNWHAGNVTYLQDLFVQPHCRGQGVGRALIAQIYKDADEEKRPYVYWLTQSFNHDARKLYDQVASLTPFIKYQRGSS